jgi:hypothetical protein
MAVYHFDKTKMFCRKPLPFSGEIYDILPWNDEIMDPLVQKLNGVHA